MRSRIRVNSSFIQSRVSSTCTRFLWPYLRQGRCECHSVELDHSPSPDRSLSIDESGDYIDWTIRDDIVHKSELGTLFGLRRKTLYHEKVLDILRDKIKLPAQPQPVSMGPATLLGQMYAYVGGQGSAGAQIDALRECSNINANPWLLILRI